MPAYRFWMVWREDSPPPAVRHWTRAAAENEARRLARGYPSHKFYLIESIGYLVTEMPSPVFHETDETAPMCGNMNQRTDTDHG